MKLLKRYFNVTLLLVALIALPGAGCEPFDKLCSVFKCCHKPGEQGKAAQIGGTVAPVETKAVAGKKDDSMVLISSGGETVFTKNDLESVCEGIAESNEQYRMIFQVYPQVRCQVFLSQIVPMEVARIWGERENKDNDPEVQQKLDQALKNLKSNLYFGMLHEEVLKSIDKSDRALETFYDQNKSMPTLQRPDFLNKSASTNALSVEFDKEEEADEFLKKAKEPNVDFKDLAKKENKEVKDLENISLDSKDQGFAVISKLNNMAVDQISKVTEGPDKFIVLKAVSKTPAERKSFAEIKDNEDLKAMLENVMLQTLSPAAVENKLEEIKKKYDIKVNSEELEKEMSEVISKLQEEQEREEAEAKAAEQAESDLEKSEKLEKPEKAEKVEKELPKKSNNNKRSKK